MKKRVLALILIFALLLLTGCNTVLTPTHATTTGDPAGTSTLPNSDARPQATHPPYSFEPDPTYPDSELTYVCYQLPETVENPDDLPVVKWVCFLDEYYHDVLRRDSLKWTEEAFQELNQMLAEKNMPFRIQFIIYDYQMPQVLTSGLRLPDVNWFERPEIQDALAEADLVWGFMSPEKQVQYLMPLTEYAEGSAQPSLSAYFPYSTNQYAAADGEIYGISRSLPDPSSTGWFVKTEFMEQMGLTAEDFSRPYWEMDELFAEIYEKNGNKPFLWFEPDGIESLQHVNSAELRNVIPSAFRSQIMCVYQWIGACFGIDLTGDVPTVVHTLETETVRNIRAAVVRYKAAGYGIPYKTGNGAEFDPRRAEVYYGINIVGDQPYTNEEDRVCIPVTPTRLGGYTVGMINGVAKDAPHKEEALSLLELLMEDEEFRIRLLYGKEGRDCTVTDGVYEKTVQADGSIYDMAFLMNIDRFSAIASQQSPVYEGMTPQESYQYRLENTDRIKLPILFDYSGFEEELEAMGAVWSKYFYDLTGLEDKDDDGIDETPIVSEELYDQMLQELKAAGSEKIQAELQRQLDEWLAENPDWLELYG